MTNTNCLEGIGCPDCGNEDRLIIAARVMAEVTDDGADVASPMYGNGFEWAADSYARCPECDREGTLKDFGHGGGGAESSPPLPSPGEGAPPAGPWPRLLTACRTVVARWEKGDLAAAVRECATALAEIDAAAPAGDPALRAALTTGA